LIPGQEVESYSDDEEEGNAEELQSKKRCKKCDTAMDVYLIDASRQLHVCGKYPDCSGTVLEEGQFRIKGYDGPLIPCDKCDSDMQLKSGRFGKYFGCTKKECTNTRKLLKSGEAAPPKCDPIHMPELKCEKSDGYFVLRDGAAGLFLASSAFPKSRETKKPQIADLVRHKDKIDPKFHNLLKAPKFDPDGNPAIVRFSRKTKEHYVGSMKDDKMTNWTLFWSGRQWTQEVVEK
jgi:DNA topoisomerase-1